MKNWKSWNLHLYSVMKTDEVVVAALFRKTYTFQFASITTMPYCIQISTEVLHSWPPSSC